MKAALCTRYGPPGVLRLEEVETPTPKDHEVRVRIRATTATAGDCEIRRFQLPLRLWLPARLYLGVFKPRQKILGIELAGEVESVGRGVTRFKRGDQVFAYTGLRFGAYAEYTCLPEDGVLAMKPTNMSYDEAAAVPLGGLNALKFLREARIQRGQSVLINGACGTIGTFAVQLAKSFGAEVTAVDSSEKLDVLLSIGADHVIDYTKEDFTKGGAAYDVVFDVVAKSSFSGSLRALKEGGCYLMTNPRLSQIIRGRWTSRAGFKRVVSRVPPETADDLVFLKGLIEAGTLKSVIDRRFPLEKIAEAHAYVEGGHKKGNVVVTIVEEQ
jgi:NADPH:quinone reductase-like Zn-dependent oxidoreductase